MKPNRFKSIDGAVRKLRQTEKILNQYRNHCAELKTERDLMARLASETAMFSNPVEFWEAKKIRDRILGA